jgi:Tol biopolymer transport system component
MNTGVLVPYIVSTWAVVLGGTALAAAPSPAQTNLLKLVTHETVIARPSVMADPATMVCSPDALHVAYVVLRGRERTVCVDGVERETYKEVDALHFSPDGKRLAYWVLQDGKRRVILDGKPGQPYDGLWEWSRTRIAVTNGGVQFLGVPQNLVFSPDSQHLAYVGAFRQERRPRPRVVLDEEEIGQHDELVDCGLVFSPDSRRLGYVARQETNCTAIIDRQVARSYDQGVVLTPQGFSADGKRVAYFAKTGGKYLVVVDGTEVGPFDQVGMASLLFSPDSRQLAFKYERDGRSHVWRNGREEGSFESIAGLTFSPDSKRLAYFVQRAGHWLACVEGSEGRPYDGMLGLLIFSPDSKRMAFAARRGNEAFTVVDGKEGRVYQGAQELRLRFSPDSRHLACAVLRAGKSLLVVDAQEGPEYDAIVELAFTGPRSIRLLARRYDEMARPEIVRAEIEIREN